MASSYDPIRGPFVKNAFGKAVVKGEDTWLQQRGLAIPLSGGKAPVEAHIFGVFDGHGGKQAAAFASKHLSPQLLKHLSDATSSCSTQSRSSTGTVASVSKDSPPQSPYRASSLLDWQDSKSADCAIPDSLKNCSTLNEDTWAAWHAQDAIVGALPVALQSAFAGVHKDFFTHTKVSGTTATVAVLVGWELIIANVGDSLAFLDTGSEVIQVSGNHRLDTNKAEQARLRQAGCELSRSTVEHKPVGPLRVWPGGLAMGRTLGDCEAGAPVLPDPEIRQVTLPPTGARLIIASDGLWDAVQPKTAAHHVRNMAASKAATELVQMGHKAKGNRDDITVIVVDAVSSSNDRLPCLLQKTGDGSLQATSAPAHTVAVSKPLDMDDSCRPWYPLAWQARLAAVEAVMGVQSATELEACSDGSDDTAFLDLASSSMSSGPPAEFFAEQPSESAVDSQGPSAGEADDEDEWVPVKAKKHALAVGSPESDASWPGSASVKSQRKEESNANDGRPHVQQPTAAMSIPQHAPSQHTAEPRLPQRSSWPRERVRQRQNFNRQQQQQQHHQHTHHQAQQMPQPQQQLGFQHQNGNAAQAQSDDVVPTAGRQGPGRQQRNQGRGHRSRGSALHRNFSQPNQANSWPMGRIEENSAGSFAMDSAKQASQLQGIKAVHAVPVPYTGGSIDPVPAATAGPANQRSGSIDIQPRQPFSQGRGNPRRQRNTRGNGASGRAGGAHQQMQEVTRPNVLTVPRPPPASSPEPAVFQFGGAARFAADGSELRP